MKGQVILITPGYPSIGLISIGSFLERNGYDVHIIRQDNFFMERLTTILDEKRCIAVGFTAMTPNINSAILASRIIKGFYPSIPILIGGIHVTALPEETLKESMFDIGIVGEGELTSLETIRKLEDGIFPTYVAGTYEKLNDGTVICNGTRSLIADLSMLPPLNYKLFDFQYIPEGIRDRRIRTSRGIQLMISRGCPYNCVFCASEMLWKRRVRFWPMEYIIDSIEFLIRCYNIDSISFADDELITHKGFITSFCEALVKNGIHKRIIWECQGRINSVSEEVLEMLKEAGCRLIRFGMESGSDKILGFLKNNTVTVGDSYNAVRLCNKHKIHCFGSFMIGSPDETLDDIMGTIELIEKSGLDSVACYTMVPYPGTRLYNICKDANLLREDVSWSDFITERYAYENIPSFVVRNHHFSSEQLYHIARYIDQNVVSRLNFGFPLSKINHRENLKCIIAGELNLANPMFKIRLCQKKDIAKGWLHGHKEFIKNIVTDPRTVKFILMKAISQLGSKINLHLFRRVCADIYQYVIKWHFRTIRHYQRKNCWCAGELLPSGWHMDWAVCVNCGCYANNYPPLLEELKRFYSLNLYWQKWQHLKGFPTLKKMGELYRSDGRLDYWLRLISQYGPSQGKAIEVDCVPGILLFELKNCGYDSIGTQASRMTADWLKYNLNLNVQVGFFPYMNLPSCDLFLAFNVLEYSIDPLIFMRKVADLLSNGGIAIIQTRIDKGNGLFPFGERFSDVFDDIGRLFIFTDKAMHELTRQCGLDLLLSDRGLEVMGGVYIFKKLK